MLSGRTNDEVKADPDAVWQSDVPAARPQVALVGPSAPPTDDELAALDALGAERHVGGRRPRAAS